MNSNITIGIDFDNTIVCYDRLFYKIANEKGLIPCNINPKKNEIRDYLREKDSNELWTELQGYVYGARMDEADYFPGVKKFFSTCKKKDIDFYVISHKTKYPVIGPCYDLHRAARQWLKINGFFSDQDFGIKDEQVIFHESIEQKIHRIAEKKCSFFIDDLPEIFNHFQFPSHTKKILFNPHHFNVTSQFDYICSSWEEIIEKIGLREIS